MKRRKLISHVKKNGCSFFREGARHSVFFNPQNGLISTIPRHNEVNDFLAKKICKDLGIPWLKKN